MNPTETEHYQLMKPYLDLYYDPWGWFRQWWIEADKALAKIWSKK